MKLKDIAIVLLSATIGAGAVTYLVNKKEYKPTLGIELKNEAVQVQEKYRKLKAEGKTLDDFTQPLEKVKTDYENRENNFPGKDTIYYTQKFLKKETQPISISEFNNFRDHIYPKKDNNGNFILNLNDTKFKPSIKLNTEEIYLNNITYIKKEDINGDNIKDIYLLGNNYSKNMDIFSTISFFNSKMIFDTFFTCTYPYGFIRFIDYDKDKVKEVITFTPRPMQCEFSTNEFDAIVYKYTLNGYTEIKRDITYISKKGGNDFKNKAKEIFYK